MAIIINDFEVAVEPAATEAGNPEEGPAAEQGSSAGQKSLSPQDVDSLMKRRINRELRVSAH